MEGLETSQKIWTVPLGNVNEEWLLHIVYESFIPFFCSSTGGPGLVVTVTDYKPLVETNLKQAWCSADNTVEHWVWSVRIVCLELYICSSG